MDQLIEPDKCARGRAWGAIAYDSIVDLWRKGDVYLNETLRLHCHDNDCSILNGGEVWSRRAMRWDGSSINIQAIYRASSSQPIQCSGVRQVFGI